MNLCLRRSFAVGRYTYTKEPSEISCRLKKRGKEGTNLLGIPLQTQRDEGTEIPGELMSESRRRVLGDEEEDLEIPNERRQDEHES